MSDIVDWAADEISRLRQENNRLKAEIERLREELDTWQSVFPDIAPERVLPDRSRLHAEIARLRAALSRIADDKTEDVIDFRAYARAALKGGDGDE